MNLLGKRFRIGDELIGVGSFGRTHIGIDFKKKREVAIKIVNISHNHNHIIDA